MRRQSSAGGSSRSIVARRQRAGPESSPITDCGSQALFAITACSSGTRHRRKVMLSTIRRPVPENQRRQGAFLTIYTAQRMIAGCEAYSQDAEIPFDNILDRLTGSDPSVTDYVLEEPARCLECGAEMREKTLVEVCLD